MNRNNLFSLITAALVASIFTDRAWSDTFGSGGNTFTIDFVTIGNPGNLPDTIGNPLAAGSVAYYYRIGKYEISRDMVEKVNNLGGLGVALDDMTTRGGNVPTHPATGVTWNQTARFVNWLNTSQGFSPAYKFTTQPGDGGYNSNQNISLWNVSDAGFNPANPFRNSLAHYFLPSADEWYKAAYYNPAGGNYFGYPTGSNFGPTPVASGTATGTAVFFQTPEQGPADITSAGGLSPYGTMAQGGNVNEWEESETDGVNDDASGIRGIRGGHWACCSTGLPSTSRSDGPPNATHFTAGFRVASTFIPEPTTVTLLTFAALACGCLRRRRS